MIYKKILFIGLGGAGQRHLRVFHSLFKNESKYYAYRKTKKTPFLNSDFTINTNKDLESEYGLKVFDNIDEAFEIKPDLTVISTPTALHKAPMFKAIDSNSNIFVEKPWAENSKNFSFFKNEVLKKKLNFHISFQRRFNPLILKTKELIENSSIGNILFVNFNIYSDLRQWHKYEDWKSLYAVNKNLGGGVLLTEIHEIDFIYWFFGIPNSLFASGGNYSQYDLDVEDTVNLILNYDMFSVQLNLCFLRSETQRNFCITGEKGSLSWNDNNNELICKVNNDSKKVYKNDLTNDDMFFLQAKKFINSWDNNETINSLNSAEFSLKIVESAKKSMKNNKIETIKNE